MDSSVYDAMVRMAQDFKMGTPLINGHGNWGSIDGDSSAAMRYTECKLQPIALELLKELNKEIVDYIPNFDDTDLEPTILPSILPNLILNGTEGIAVGFKTEIPPHNLNEVVNALIAYIKNPKITINEILDILPAPDYPTGGIIVNKEDMLNLYSTGEGTVSIRAKIETEESSYGKTNLIVTDIPFTQSGRKQYLIEDIANLIKDKKIDSISDIRDESQGEDVRIVIEVKKGFKPEDIKHILYKKTKLQDNQTCNFLVIDKGVPRTIDIKEYFRLYLEFQEEIMTKKYNILLKKALTNKEKLEGLLKAIGLIDVLIEVLRGAKNREAVKSCFKKGDTSNITFKTKKNEKIAKTFDFTELQCNAILEMKLERLINLEEDKLLADKAKLEREITQYINILSNRKNLLKVIIKNLKDIEKTYGVKRKTKLTNSKIKIIEEKIIEEDVQILIDRFGYIKTVDLSSIQKSSEDIISQYKFSLVAKNTEKICIFTKSGMLYQLKTMDIPKVKIKDKGTPLDVILKLDKNDDILLITSSEKILKNKLLFVLSDGFVRLVPSEEFNTNRQCIVATKVDGNELLAIKIISLQENLTIKTNKKSYRIDLIKMPSHKKTVKGKKVISLKKEEEISKIEIKELDEVAITKE